jgi:hypothetical protein
MGRGCRSMAHIACTRYTKTIITQNREEMKEAVESDLGVQKEVEWSS